MFKLRCTKKLLSYMKATPIAVEPAPTTTALGDWYANLIPTCRGGVVICTNERTLLTVVLPLIEDQHPLTMLTLRTFDLLRRLGVSEAAADAELNQMAEVTIHRAQSRKVLGTMNEIAATLQYLADTSPPGPLKVSQGEILIAQTIFSYTKYIPPQELVRALLCPHDGSVT